MTRITFFKKRGKFLGFVVKGHTGKDEYGKDLLCAQISTVAQLAVVGICEVEKLKTKNKEISDGYLILVLDDNEENNPFAQFLFKTCYESFKSIIIDEKKYAKLEVKNV